MRTNLGHFEICFRIIHNIFDRIRKTFWILFNANTSKINLIQSNSFRFNLRLQSKRIWAIFKYVSELFIIFWIESEKRFEFCSMKISLKSIWFHPIHSGSIWGFNPNESGAIPKSDSEKRFEFCSMQIG